LSVRHRRFFITILRDFCFCTQAFNNRTITTIVVIVVVIVFFLFIIIIIIIIIVFVFFLFIIIIIIIVRFGDFSIRNDEIFEFLIFFVVRVFYPPFSFFVVSIIHIACEIPPEGPVFFLFFVREKDKVCEAFRRPSITTQRVTTCTPFVHTTNRLHVCARTFGAFFQTRFSGRENNVPPPANDNEPCHRNRNPNRNRNRNRNLNLNHPLEPTSSGRKKN